MWISRLGAPRTAAALYKRTKPVCLAALTALFGLAPALGKRGRRLTQTGRAEAIFQPGLGHRKPVGFGRTPAIGAEAAFERYPATGAGKLTRGGRGRHATNLRASGGKGKVVI